MSADQYSPNRSQFFVRGPMFDINVEIRPEYNAERVIYRVSKKWGDPHLLLSVGQGIAFFSDPNLSATHGAALRKVAQDFAGSSLRYKQGVPPQIFDFLAMVLKATKDVGPAPVRPRGAVTAAPTLG